MEDLHGRDGWLAVARSNSLARRRLDARLQALRPLADVPRPHRGWIRAIRDALGMSGTELAVRLGVSQQTIHDLERSEQHDTMKLETLRRPCRSTTSRSGSSTGEDCGPTPTDRRDRPTRPDRRRSHRALGGRSARPHPDLHRHPRRAVRCRTAQHRRGALAPPPEPSAAPGRQVPPGPAPGDVRTCVGVGRPLPTHQDEHRDRPNAHRVQPWWLSERPS